MLLHYDLDTNNRNTEKSLLPVWKTLHYQKIVNWKGQKIPSANAEGVAVLWIVI